MKHILLVDDHKTFLAGTALILEKHGFQVTTATSGIEALERMESASFDLFLFDLKLPGMNGFELTEETMRKVPEAIVVILTGKILPIISIALSPSGSRGFWRNLLENRSSSPVFAYPCSN